MRIGSSCWYAHPCLDKDQVQIDGGDSIISDQIKKSPLGLFSGFSPGFDVQNCYSRIHSTPSSLTIKFSSLCSTLSTLFIMLDHYLSCSHIMIDKDPGQFAYRKMGDRSESVIKSQPKKDSLPLSSSFKMYSTLFGRRGSCLSYVIWARLNNIIREVYFSTVSIWSTRFASIFWRALPSVWVDGRGPLYWLKIKHNDDHGRSQNPLKIEEILQRLSRHRPWFWT